MSGARLPKRFLKDTIHDKCGEPRILSKEDFFKSRLNWYRSMGLTEEGGSYQEDAEAG